ncbi:hypothetical protein [Aquimarina megaterium]|uniref:hypothetical protein n=1 Tax=Aquimarina megaterium TaxID=1443666 RepID=UPI00046EE99F|nr:hypothetical protein [Aquimarina megaterium]
MKKKKEDIRNQILKKVKYYRNSRGIIFFDNPNNQFKENIVLDNNELEVLLIKLKRSRKIIVTTKHIYSIDKNLTTKILAQDIDRFDYMEFINGEKIIEGGSKIKIMLLRFKMNFRIGNYRIVQRNGSFTELIIWRTRFADCLNGCIKKLKFVGNKYDAI